MAGTIIRGENFFYNTRYEGNGGAQKVGKFIPFTDQSTLDHGLIFNVADGPKLQKEVTTTGNRRTFTISAWVKRTSFGNNSYIFFAGESGNAYTRLWLDSSDRRLHCHSTNSAGSNKMSVSTNQTFESTSKFYHIVAAFDTTQASDANKIKIYVDGEQITDFSYSGYSGGQNYDTEVNKDNSNHTWGQAGHYAAQGLEGYLAQCILVDGTAYGPDTFGITDTATGRWIPKSLGSITYGTNGARLDFANTAGQTFGDDTSGQGNDFTVTNLTASDLTTDSPTQNHCVLSNNLARGSVSLTEGGLKLQSSSTNYACCATTMEFSENDSQGYYFETKVTGSTRSTTGILIMRGSVDVAGLSSDQQHAGCFGINARGGGGSNQYWFTVNGSYDGTTGVAHGANDVLQVAFKNGKVWFGINNTYLLSGNPATGANPTFSNIAGEDFRFLICTYSNYDILECNFGQKTYAHTAPTGFVALQQDNRPAESSKGVPDLVWIKNRDASDSWVWADTLRGPKIYGSSGSSTTFNTAQGDGVQKFIKGGVEVEDADIVNTSSESFVSFNWVANNAVTAVDTTGDLSTEVQSNPSTGVAISRFTVSGSGNVTWAHNLGAVPHVGILCAHGGTNYGTTYHHKNNATPYSAYLLTTSDQALETNFVNGWGTGPTSTLWTGKVGSLFSAGETYMFYSFVGIPGFSHFGSYTGNANADGPFIYTGFKPSWLMIKRTSSTGEWFILDRARNPNNTGTKEYLDLNTTDAGASLDAGAIDWLSNGFKLRQVSSQINNGNHVYFAFAEHPFNGNGEGAFATAI